MKTQLRYLVLAAAAGCAVGGWMAAQAAEPERVQQQAEVRERIYGSQLMTEQERNEYRARMRTLRTAQEREQFRKEHHERMQERARERGLTLPDDGPGRAAGPREAPRPGPGPRTDPPGGGPRGR